MTRRRVGPEPPLPPSCPRCGRRMDVIMEKPRFYYACEDCPPPWRIDG